MKISYYAVKDKNHPFLSWLLSCFSLTISVLAGPLLILSLIGTGGMIFEAFELAEMMGKWATLCRDVSVGFIISIVLFLYLTLKKNPPPRIITILGSIICLLLTVSFLVWIFVFCFQIENSSILLSVFMFLISIIIPALMIVLSVSRIKKARKIK